MAPAVGDVAHGSVNTRPGAERARTAHRQKKEPWPLTPIVSPGFCVMNFCFLFFSEALKKKRHGLSGCKKKVPPNLELWVSIFFYSRESERERTTFERFLFDILWQGENMTRAKNCHHTTLHSVLSNKYNTHSKDSR